LIYHPDYETGFRYAKPNLELSNMLLVLSDDDFDEIGRKLGNEMTSV
jgi:hypothetical protein